MSSNLPTRRFSRRQFIKTATAATGGLLIAGCAPIQPGAPAAPAAPAATQAPAAPAATAAPAAAKEIVITTLFAAGGITDAVHEEMVAFKKLRPEITFKETVIDMEQLRATEVNILTNPGAPHLIFLNYGSGLTEKLAAAKAVIPLDKWYDQYGWWKFLPAGLKTHGVDGQVYHYSLSTGTAPLIWFNKTLLAKVGKPMPTMGMDEVFAWADACHAAGLEPLAMGDRDGWPGFHMYDTLALRSTTADDFNKIVWFSKKGKDAKMADIPGFKEAFQIMRDMQEKKVWSNGVLDLNDEEAKSLFMSGKSVAYETGPWATDQLRKALGDDLDFVLFPQLKADIPLRMMAGWYEEFMVSSQASPEVQDAIGAFFDYALSKEGQRPIAKYSQLPIRTDMTAKDMEGAADPLKGKLAEMIGGKVPNSNAINDYWTAEMYALLRSNGQAAISAQKTPDQIVKEFDDLAAKERAA